MERGENQKKSFKSYFLTFFLTNIKLLKQQQQCHMLNNSFAITFTDFEKYCL